MRERPILGARPPPSEPTFPPRWLPSACDRPARGRTCEVKARYASRRAQALFFSPRAHTHTSSAPSRPDLTLFPLNSLSYPHPHSRAAQAAETGGNEKEAVKAYFNNVGFDRWSRIYSESDDVNSVQRDIREGHAQTVEKVLGWLGGSPLAGVSVCDAGCGTGSLAIPLAFKGASITATDISAAMADEAARRYEAEAAAPGAPPRPATPPTFAAASLDELSGGPWDVVTCIDVLIHYPQAKVDAMLASLVGKASKKVILSFAPSTPYYEVNRGRGLGGGGHGIA